jgi:hypothetical protein
LNAGNFTVNPGDSSASFTLAANATAHILYSPSAMDCGYATIAWTQDKSSAQFGVIADYRGWSDRRRYRADPSAESATDLGSLEMTHPSRSYFAGVKIPAKFKLNTVGWLHYGNVPGRRFTNTSEMV